MAGHGGSCLGNVHREDTPNVVVDMAGTADIY